MRQPKGHPSDGENILNRSIFILKIKAFDNCFSTSKIGGFSGSDMGGSVTPLCGSSVAPLWLLSDSSVVPLAPLWPLWFLCGSSVVCGSRTCDSSVAPPWPHCGSSVTPLWPLWFLCGSL